MIYAQLKRDPLYAQAKSEVEKMIGDAVAPLARRIAALESEVAILKMARPASIPSAIRNQPGAR